MRAHVTCILLDAMFGSCLWKMPALLPYSVDDAFASQAFLSSPRHSASRASLLHPGGICDNSSTASISPKPWVPNTRCSAEDLERLSGPGMSPPFDSTAVASLPRGPYGTNFTVETMDGLLAGGSDKVFIAWPMGGPDERFPLISWLHGNSAGGNVTAYLYGEVFHRWASFGFVVVAVASCTGSTCLSTESAAFAADQRTAIRAATANPNHAVFSKVDAGRVVIGGHSVGAAASVHNAINYPEAGFLALVALNSCWLDGITSPNTSSIRAPTLYATSTTDCVCPRQSVREQYCTMSATVPKVYLETRDSGHFQVEPFWGALSARFLNCHVRSPSL